MDAEWIVDCFYEICLLTSCLGLAIIGWCFYKTQQSFMAALFWHFYINLFLHQDKEKRQ